MRFFQLLIVDARTRLAYFRETDFLVLDSALSGWTLGAKRSTNP